MTTENEEVTPAEDITTVTPDAPKAIEEMTADEIKAEAEKIEAEIKEKEGNSKEETIKHDQTRRLEKAREKLARLKNPTQDTTQKTETKTQEMATDDIVTLRIKGFAKDSDEAKVLKKYRDAGIISDYESGLNHIAVKAELDAITASRTARVVIDENDKNKSGETTTSKQILARYRTSGEVPADKKAQEVIANDNLKSMGI